MGVTVVNDLQYIENKYTAFTAVHGSLDSTESLTISVIFLILFLYYVSNNIALLRRGEL